ncbi:hypothetical protein, partial [Amycolatopsis thermoflava]|uniref:hypothetical protein n=1 Tax=Amycolatopsis thermoflava TaxID=84480 RepID=UPI00365FF756
MQYQGGDVVGLRTKSGSRAMRTRQLAVSWDKDGKPEGSVVFGARFKTPEEVLSDRLAQLSGNSLDRGRYNNPLSPNYSAGLIEQLVQVIALIPGAGARAALRPGVAHRVLARCRCSGPPRTPSVHLPPLPFSWLLSRELRSPGSV